MSADVVSPRQVGLIFGKFYPLHCGHIYMIEKAESQVDELHIMLGCEEARDLKLFAASQLVRQPLVKDRFYWLEETFRNRPNIHVHILNEEGIEYYPNGWKDWSDRVKGILQEHNAKPTIIFTSEPQDAEQHERHYGCPVQVMDADRSFMNISATTIRNNPYENWSFIAKKAQPFFVRRIAIISNKASGNLAQKFANFYNTEYVTNGYVHYLQRGQESQLDILSEDDYVKVALLHAERISQATDRANRYLFTDLNFDILQSYFETTFKHRNALIDGLIGSYPFDLIIDVNQWGDDLSREAYFDKVLEIVRDFLY